MWHCGCGYMWAVAHDGSGVALDAACLEGLQIGRGMLVAEEEQQRQRQVVVQFPRRKTLQQ